MGPSVRLEAGARRCQGRPDRRRGPRPGPGARHAGRRPVRRTVFLGQGPVCGHGRDGYVARRDGPRVRRVGEPGLRRRRFRQRDELRVRPGPRRVRRGRPRARLRVRLRSRLGPARRRHRRPQPFRAVGIRRGAPGIGHVGLRAFGRPEAPSALRLRRRRPPGRPVRRQGPALRPYRLRRQRPRRPPAQRGRRDSLELRPVRIGGHGHPRHRRGRPPSPLYLYGRRTSRHPYLPRDGRPRRRHVVLHLRRRRPRGLGDAALGPRHRLPLRRRRQPGRKAPKGFRRRARFPDRPGLAFRVRPRHPPAYPHRRPRRGRDGHRLRRQGATRRGCRAFRGHGFRPGRRGHPHVLRLPRASGTRHGPFGRHHRLRLRRRLPAAVVRDGRERRRNGRHLIRL